VIAGVAVTTCSVTSPLATLACGRGGHRARGRVIAFSKYGTALKQFMADSRVEAAQDRVAEPAGDRHDHAVCSSSCSSQAFSSGVSISRSPGHAGTDRTRGLTVALRWYVVQCLFELRAPRAGVAQRAHPAADWSEVRRNPRPNRRSGRDAGWSEAQERAKFYPAMCSCRWRWMRTPGTWCAMCRRCSLHRWHAGEARSITDKEAMQIASR